MDKTTGTPNDTPVTPAISPFKYVVTVKILWLSVIIVEIRFEIAYEGPYSVAPFFYMMVFPAFLSLFMSLGTSISTDWMKYFNGIPPIVVELNNGTI